MTDDDLRSRLRRTDPAASLAPLPPDRVSRLLEESMSAAPRRSRLPLLAAAAAVLLLAGVGWLLLRPEPEVGVNLMQAPPSPAAVRLTTPADSAAKCRQPEAATLASAADFAFAGTVTGIDAANLVTLRVTRIYQGGPATEVQVDQQPDSSETMMGSGRFETGKSYLIAASEGTVMICGFSGEADIPTLVALYEEAF